MTADLIDLSSRRTAAQTAPASQTSADDIKEARPDLSLEACHMIAEHWNTNGRAAKRPERLPLTVAPDDPIHALWSAFKEAETAYRSAINVLARRTRRKPISVAKIVQRAREARDAKPKYLSTAEFAAKYEALSPAAKARFLRKFGPILDGSPA